MAEPRRAADSEALSVLLGLSQRARRVETLKELGFVMVNETLSLVRYRQAVLWSPTNGIISLSGIAVTERNAPFAIWLSRLLRGLANDLPKLRKLTQDEFRGIDREQWAEWLPPHLLALPMHAPDRTQIGILAFARDEPWSEAETLFLAEIAETYGLAMAWHAKTTVWRRFRNHLSKLRYGWAAVVIALVLVCLIPVRLSVLAPAEIVGRDPAAIRAPIDGVIDKVLVRPNAVTAKDTLLFTLDTTVTTGKLDVAQKALATARSEYEQSAQEAFSDPKAKARLGVLAGRIGERKAEIEYLQNILARSEVRAPRDGVTVMGDPSEWSGKPVSVGEKILAIADDHDTEVEGWLAPGNLIDIQPGAKATVFLNVDPLNPLHATLRYIAYESLPRPDGTVAHRLRATLADDVAKPRLGLMGTIRLDGDQVPLIYWLLRRPLAIVRQNTGL